MAYGARLLSGFGIKPVEGSNPSASALVSQFRHDDLEVCSR